MDGRKVSILVLACWLLGCHLPPIFAQQGEQWMDVAEESLNRDEDSGFAIEQCEEQQELLFYPIKLNRATQIQLESCGLFTPFQARSILQYREAYGDLLSVYELASLPCFRIKQLEEQSIYMTVDKAIPINPVKHQGSKILFYAGRTFSNSEKQVDHPGSIWKTSLRLKKGLGRRMSVGLAYAKDAGEKGLWGYRPEHLCGYLEWKGKRILEQLIFGTYRLNNGMGLTQGAGLMHAPPGIHSRPLLLSSLKPYAGAGESINHQGLACKLNLGMIKAVLWSSFQTVDLSLQKAPSPDEKTDWAGFIREGGYHRSPTELSGRNLAYLGSAGIQVMVNLDRLTLGVQYAPEINGLTGKGKDSLQYFEGPSLHHATSLQAQWKLNKLELYGEFAPGAKKTGAFLAGSRFFFNDFLSGTLQFHWYGASHRATFASAYASGSHIENEMGMLLFIHAEPFRRIRADMAMELFEYPAPRTLVKVPSSGFRFSLTLQNGSVEQIQWRLRLVNTKRQKTPSSYDGPGIRPLSNYANNRIDGRVVYGPHPRLAWQSRLVISFTPGTKAGLAHAALQHLSVQVHKSLKFTGQFVIYHVPSWDNRIYIHEPSLYQQFRFPVLYGTGNKISMLTSVKPGKRITLEARVSVVHESEKRIWETDLQLRLNF